MFWEIFAAIAICGTTVSIIAALVIDRISDGRNWAWKVRLDAKIKPTLSRIDAGVQRVFAVLSQALIWIVGGLITVLGLYLVIAIIGAMLASVAIKTVEVVHDGIKTDAVQTRIDDAKAAYETYKARRELRELGDKLEDALNAK